MFIQEAQYGHAHIKTSTWPSSIQEAPYNNVHTGGSTRPASYMRFGMVMHIQGDSAWSCSYSRPTWLCSYRRLNMAMPRFLALSLIYLDRQIFQTNQTCSFIGRCWQIKKDWGFWKLWRLLQRASIVLEDYLNKTFEKEDKEYNLLGSKTNKGNQGNQTQERKHRKLIASLAVN